MLQKTVNKLVEQNQKKDERICELEQMLLNAQRARFGQHSEKRVYVLDDGNEQLSMFGEATTDAADTSEAQDEGQQDETPDDNGEIEVSAHTRKPKRTLEELCRNLPVEERIIDLPEEEKINADGKPLTYIGMDPIRTEIEVERTRAKVVKYFRKVYKDEAFAQKIRRYAHYCADDADSAAATQLSVQIISYGRAYSEVCGWPAAVPAGTDMEAAGASVKARHNGELGDTVIHALLPPVVEADEGKASGAGCHPRG